MSTCKREIYLDIFEALGIVHRCTQYNIINLWQRHNNCKSGRGRAVTVTIFLVGKVPSFELQFDRQFNPPTFARVWLSISSLIASPPISPVSVRYNLSAVTTRFHYQLQRRSLSARIKNVVFVYWILIAMDDTEKIVNRQFTNERIEQKILFYLKLNVQLYMYIHIYCTSI